MLSGVPVLTGLGGIELLGIVTDDCNPLFGYEGDAGGGSTTAATSPTWLPVGDPPGMAPFPAPTGVMTPASGEGQTYKVPNPHWTPRDSIAK